MSGENVLLIVRLCVMLFALYALGYSYASYRYVSKIGRELDAKAKQREASK